VLIKETKKLNEEKVVIMKLIICQTYPAGWLTLTNVILYTKGVAKPQLGSRNSKQIRGAGKE
jgi:hypothetical protein